MTEEEILANNIELITKGYVYPGDLDMCMIYGMNGYCGKRCPRFKNKSCDEYLTTLENKYNSDEKEIERLNEELGDANYTITQLHKVMERHYVKKEDYDRLNNIIKTFEGYLDTVLYTYKNDELSEARVQLELAKDKLKELKEGK